MRLGKGKNMGIQRENIMNKNDYYIWLSHSSMLGLIFIKIQILD